MLEPGVVAEQEDGRLTPTHTDKELVRLGRDLALLAGDVDFIAPVPPTDLARIKDATCCTLITMPSTRVITFWLMPMPCKNSTAPGVPISRCTSSACRI